MPAPFFIGDPVSAAGFRLAGARILTPAPGEEDAAFRTALAEGELVLITAAVAEKVPAAFLARALAAPTPLVLVTPDVRETTLPPDLSAVMRAQLGLEE